MELPGLMERCLGGAADAGERRRFRALWQDRVRRLLLELDGSRCRLAIAEAEADLVSLVAEQELARIERRAATGALYKTQGDEQRRSIPAQRQAAQALENQLRLIPARGW